MLTDSTCYWGLIKETGIWPVEKKILYQRLMLYQSLMTSDDLRLEKLVLTEQIKNKKDGWYKETWYKARELGIKLEEVRTKSKAEWKKVIKERIGKK